VPERRGLFRERLLNRSRTTTTIDSLLWCTMSV